MNTPPLQGLYAIVDLPHPHGLDPVAITRAVLGDRLDGGTTGAAVVQLRAKNADTAQRIAWLEAMSGSCQAAGVPLIANDDLDAATRARGVDGVHLGQLDEHVDAVAEIRAAHPELMIGLSTHDIPQLRDALRQKPDYVAFGPVARTQSKQDPDPIVGLSGLADAGRVTSRPLVAIGGLDAGRARQAIQHGASMAAVIGALAFRSEDETRAAAMELAKGLQEAARPLTVDAVAELIPVLEKDLLSELARWGDSFSVHMALELPARFAPKVVDGVATYRYCEVLDLIHALGKRPTETWEQWKRRGHDDGSVVHLRRS
ncbi:MAG: thiamine phosphate synthase [Myxococcota bacterium]